jgi:chromate transporter
MLWDLFITFLMIGAVSFGGGYSMIPLLEREAVREHGWLTLQQFTDMVAVAGMSPGPIATNSAVFIGYEAAGIPGALAAGLGTVLPSLALVVAAANVFYRLQKHVLMKQGFYGLRPIIAGMIFFGGITFAIGNHVIPLKAEALNWHTLGLAIICILSFIALFRYRIHPGAVLLLSAITGIVLYG